MNLENHFEVNKIDYAEVLRGCLVSIRDLREVDISIVIPVHGRLQFNDIVTKHIIEASKKTELKVAITFVEHSLCSDHYGRCASNVNYIHIPKTVEEKFNKCLCHNIGALYSNKSKYLMFHDVDTIMQSDFFLKLEQNLKGRHAVQCYTKQRLLHCDESLTEDIFDGKFSIDDLSRLHIGISEPTSGAVGGSICIERVFFNMSGGFAPEFFSQYSIEDAFFWNCVSLFIEIGKCDDPEIELFHLHHQPSFNRTTKPEDWDAYNRWQSFNLDQKLSLTKLRRDYLFKFYDEAI